MTDRRPSESTRGAPDEQGSLPVERLDTLKIDQLLNETSSVLDAAYLTRRGPGGRKLYFDQAHVPPALPNDQAEHVRRRGTSGAESGGIGILLAAACGSAGVACGAALIVWSFAGGAGNLLSLGVPLALVGQLVLIVVVICRVDRSRESGSPGRKDGSRRVIHETESAGNRFGQHGRHAATAERRPKAIEDAQQFLADLKSQLDVLADKLSRDDP